MSPQRQTLLSLVFACICLSKSLLIRLQMFRDKFVNIVCLSVPTLPLQATVAEVSHPSDPFAGLKNDILFK